MFPALGGCTQISLPPYLLSHSLEVSQGHGSGSGSSLLPQPLPAVTLGTCFCQWQPPPPSRDVYTGHTPSSPHGRAETVPHNTWP